MTAGGAATSLPVLHFFEDIGVPIFEGYDDDDSDGEDGDDDDCDDDDDDDDMMILVMYTAMCSSSSIFCYDIISSQVWLNRDLSHAHIR